MTAPGAVAVAAAEATSATADPVFMGAVGPASAAEVVAAPAHLSPGDASGRRRSAVLDLVGRTSLPGQAAFSPAAGQAAVRRATASMHLSLVLILVAFFIVMAAISKKDGTREAMALGSVAATFADPTVHGPSDDAAQVDAGAVLNGGTAMPNHGEPFATRLGMVVVERTGRGARLHLAIPVDRVFFPRTADLRLDVREQFADVAASVAGGAEWTALTILVPPVGVETVDRALAAARAGRLGEMVTRSGVERRAISVGVARAGPAMVRFRFEVDPDPAEVQAPR